MPTSAILSVFIDRDYVGSLYNETPLAFAYDLAWLARPDARAIDVAIPLEAGKNNSNYVYAFFENLLPEGEQRQFLSLRHHVTTVFGLLAQVGGDTAGAVVLMPQGETPHVIQYERTSWENLGSQFRGIEPDEFAEERAFDKAQPRLSISGAQFKRLVSIDMDGAPLLPLGNSPSTHIIKPDIVRTDLKIFASALNETILMRAALHCGLPTAEVFYQAQIHACVVKRFDRQVDSDRRLIRLPQVDLCQLAGKPSDVKYEIDGGPGFVDCFRLVSTYSGMPAVDQRHLLKWLFFNLYTGNNDSHAKNLSLLSTKSGTRLAPFYDLMCTRLYPGLGRHFAFQIGGEYEPGQLQASHFGQLASELGINARYLQSIADDLAKKLPSAIDQACAELNHTLANNERILVERLKQKITSLTHQIHSRIMHLAESEAR